ncbi:MAG: dialkylresorcinol condensing enzyme [Lentisphaerae bacterium]|nr:MAG: dialkylresorcinol condensing enzyme [Lentisphaerota bacterium]
MTNELSPVACSSSSKNILFVYYSQSGQLKQVLDALAAPLAEYNCQWLELHPDPPYPFPWPFWEFLDCFPETVLLDPPPLADFQLPPDDRVDLIILGYQAWFLSPSPPITAFLKEPRVRTFLRGKRVITLVACRNMWLKAHETVSSMLNDMGARHIGHIALTDQAPGMASFVTTPRWLLTGRKDAFWIFPPAGIAPEDIRNTARFGLAIQQAFRSGLPLDENLFKGLKAAPINPDYILPETMAHRGFMIWSRLIAKLSRPHTFRRRVLLFLYLTVLLAYIILVIPLLVLLRFLLTPLLKPVIAKKRQIYSRPSGEDDERLQDFLAQLDSLRSDG